MIKGYDDILRRLAYVKRRMATAHAQARIDPIMRLAGLWLLLTPRAAT